MRGQASARASQVVPNSVTANELDECAEHVIEAAPELGIDLCNVAERGGNLATREHLPQ